MTNQAITQQTLDNGLTVLAVENPAADIVACRVFLKAGSRCEPLEKAGLSHLLSTVITKGTQSLSSIEIAEKVESVGASLGASAGTDYFLMSLKTVGSDFLPMLQLMGEIICQPSFPEAEVELERHLTLQNIRSQQEQPFNVAFDQLRGMMYPNHPYGVSILGTPETAANLTSEDLIRYHKAYFRPENMVVSICGRIKPKQALEAVQGVFGDWHNAEAQPDFPRLPTPTASPQRQTITQDTQQAIVILGYLTPRVNDPDYATLKLLNTYLGNGLSSRLFVELREKRGLAYDVSSFYPTRLDPSVFAVYMGTAPENGAIAISGLQQEVDRLTQTLLTSDELQAAKNKLLGQYALGKQTNAEIAQVYGWYEILGLGLEFDTQFQQRVSQVTSEEALEVAKRHFTQPYISLVSPQRVH
jgi:zinc protease